LTSCHPRNQTVEQLIADFAAIGARERSRARALVVEKQTTQCWSWAGQVDQDLRPIFGGEKAYRVMYEERIGSVPAGWHVHDKCQNSSCVNPRHLIALPEAVHREVHSHPERAEMIYRDWQPGLETVLREPWVQALRQRYQQRREFDNLNRTKGVKLTGLRYWEAFRDYLKEQEEREARRAEARKQEQLRQERERREASLRELERRFGPYKPGADLDKAIERLAFEPETEAGWGSWLGYSIFWAVVLAILAHGLNFAILFTVAVALGFSGDGLPTAALRDRTPAMD
jgi:hypothetical protein